MWASVQSNCPEAHVSPFLPPFRRLSLRRQAWEGQLSSADRDEIAANQRDAPPCPYHSHPRWHARRFKWGRDACELRPRGSATFAPSLALSSLLRSVGRTQPGESQPRGLDPAHRAHAAHSATANRGDERGEGESLGSRRAFALRLCSVQHPGRARARPGVTLL